MMEIERKTMDELIREYVNADINTTKASYNRMYKRINPFEIADVIFHDPATIIKWADGTKTVVKVQDGETYDPEKGLAMAITKKALGNKGNYYNEIKKWLEKYDAPMMYPNIDIHFDVEAASARLRHLKSELNSIFGVKRTEDVIEVVNKSIENTFTKDRLE